MSEIITLHAPRPWPHRVLWIGAAALAMGGAFAAGSWWRAPQAPSAVVAAPVEAVAVAPALAAPAAPPALQTAAEPAPQPVPEREAAAPRPVHKAPHSPKAAPAPAPAPAPVAEAARPDPVPSPAPAADPLPTRRVAAVCADCGTIEAVRPVVQKGEGSGLGAVAGGVIGGALGNQIGKGNGRKAMTVIGAIGGGLAGHEIEKRTRSTTQYEVVVRMDDGSRRTLMQASEPTPGARVIVDGDTLRPAADRSSRRTGADDAT